MKNLNSKKQNHTSHFTHHTSQKGITLIALIITIIVMLILVGVTINVALNGGLFQKAETATKETEEKSILEEMLAMMEITDEGKFAYDTIISNMRTKHPEYTIAYSYPNATITGKLGTYNYIVSETEIKIGGSGVQPIDSDLEKYIMGQTGDGRTLMGENGIIDQSNFSFLDDPLTEDVDETATLGVEFLTTGQNEDMTKGFIYARYDDKAYKITCDVTTFKSENLEVIYEPTGKEGQTTADGWTILYDNGTTAEAVSPEAMGSLRLGYSETATSETKLTEAISSYNNAITTINNYCKNELTGLPTNTGVRSVGASSETSEYYSDIPASWNSVYNGVGKKGDTLFEQDLVRMAYYDVLATGTSYWIASRVVGENSGYVDFCVCLVDVSSGFFGNYSLCNVYSSGNAYGYDYSCAVRPIITYNIEN